MVSARVVEVQVLIQPQAWRYMAGRDAFEAHSAAVPVHRGVCMRGYRHALP